MPGLTDQEAKVLRDTWAIVAKDKNAMGLKFFQL